LLTIPHAEAQGKEEDARNRRSCCPADYLSTTLRLIFFRILCEYIDYLDTIKYFMPIELFNFITDPNRHNDSNESLHDSILGNIQFFVDFEANYPNMIITLL
jgi:hypothetical protein